MSLLIRAYKPEDWTRVVEVIFESYVKYNAILELDGYDNDLMKIPEHYKEGAFWVLESEGNVIGAISVLREKESASIHRLYLDHAFHGKGFGRMLLKRALTWAKVMGYRHVYLWSDVRFTKAHEMYQRNGFTRTDERVCNDIEKSKEYKFEISIH